MIKAIETRYAGCRFRSRLEARWAVFFDRLNIPWEYEPQGYELPSGRYLPDFYLPKQAAHFEVKGVAPDDKYAELLADLVRATKQRLVLAVGSIPNPDAYEVQAEGALGATFWMEIFDGRPVEGPDGVQDFGWDNYQTWSRCDRCGSLDVQYDHRFCRNYCGCYAGQEFSVHYADEVVLDAYTAARSARFEHGERGA